MKKIATTKVMKKTLIMVIKDACGCSDGEAIAIARDAGYFHDDGNSEGSQETLSQECKLIGTCWDGNNSADVWELEMGGYHSSCQAGEFYDEELPEGFLLF